jgi:hypothetical protein
MAAAPPPGSSAPARVVTRLQNQIVKPNMQYDGYVRYGNLCLTGEPEDVQQALEDPK